MTSENEIAIAHKAQEQFDEYEREIAALRAALADCDEVIGRNLPPDAPFVARVTHTPKPDWTVTHPRSTTCPWCSEPRAEGLLTYEECNRRIRAVEARYQAATPPAEGLREAAVGLRAAAMKASAHIVVTNDYPDGVKAFGILCDAIDVMDRVLDAATPPAEGLDVERLTTVLYDWMPDGADVSVGFDGRTAHLTGADLARYIFDRAREYAALAPEQPE